MAICEESSDRNGFIKKVYGIVSAQLALTAVFTTLPLVSETIREFMYSSLFLLPIFGLAAIIVELVILCNKNLARQVPHNYICLGVFTFC